MNKTSLTVQRIKDLLNIKERVVVAIDGMCGSGKTTLANELAAQLSATVIHTDDFFLRPEQRNDERLKTPGGNIDVERLLDEVILPITYGHEFFYKPFDCHTVSFKEENLIFPSEVIILEGSYSCHPKLFSYCDLHIFLHIDKFTQIKRILLRSGYDKTAEFINKWIPLENKYFEYFDIMNKCELKFHVKENDYE